MCRGVIEIYNTIKLPFHSRFLECRFFVRVDFLFFRCLIVRFESLLVVVVVVFVGVPTICAIKKNIKNKYFLKTTNLILHRGCLDECIDSFEIALLRLHFFVVQFLSQYWQRHSYIMKIK